MVKTLHLAKNQSIFADEMCRKIIELDLHRQDILSSRKIVEHNSKLNEQDKDLTSRGREHIDLYGLRSLPVPA